MNTVNLIMFNRSCDTDGNLTIQVYETYSAPRSRISQSLLRGDSPYQAQTQRGHVVKLCRLTVPRDDPARKFLYAGHKIRGGVVSPSWGEKMAKKKERWQKRWQKRKEGVRHLNRDNGYADGTDFGYSYI